MATVTFPIELGGSGLVVSDDTDPTTGLRNGGYLTRFVPALQQTVAVAGFVVAQAGAAASSAGAASSSASSAASSAASAATLYDQFDDRYLGPKAANPTVDNDGNALLVGAMYFNTVAMETRVWNGTAWQSPSVIGGTVNNLTVTGAFEYQGALTGSTSVLNIGNGQIYKDILGNVCIGTSDTTDNVRLKVIGNTAGGSRAMLRLDATDGVGGGGRQTFISFAGTSNDTGQVQTEFGYIGAAKENATQGNTRGYLVGAVNTGSGLLEAFRATADRSFLIGTATANDARLKVAPTATVDRYGIYLAGTYTGGAGLSGSVYGAYIQGFATNSSTTIYGIYADTPSAVGQTCYGGFFRAAGSASNNSYGSYSETTQTDTNGPGIAHGVYGKVTSGGTNSLGVTWAGYFENDSATGLVASGLGVSTVSGAATVYGMQYAHNASVVFQVLANGSLENATNSYGAISDPKLKDIIGPKASTWEKTKQYNWIEYYLKSDADHNFKMLGLNAEEAAAISPGVVDEAADLVKVPKIRQVPVQIVRTDENDNPVLDEQTGNVIYDEVLVDEEYTEWEPNGEFTKSVKYSVVSMQYHRTTQECQTRIESLESAKTQTDDLIQQMMGRVAALEALSS